MPIPLFKIFVRKGHFCPLISHFWNIIYKFTGQFANWNIILMTWSIGFIFFFSYFSHCARGLNPKYITTYYVSVCKSFPFASHICDMIKGNESLVGNIQFWDFNIIYLHISNPTFWSIPHYNPTSGSRDMSHSLNF